MKNRNVKRRNSITSSHGSPPRSGPSSVPTLPAPRSETSLLSVDNPVPRIDQNAYKAENKMIQS